MKEFYNTTKESGSELIKLERKAKAQAHQVYELFDDDNTLTSYDCFKALGCKYMNTSIRRCLSNLKSAGLIVKTEERRKGFYGVNLVVWRKCN